MSRSEILNRILRWILNIFVFVAIPSFLIFHGFKRIEELKNHQKVQIMEQQAQAELIKAETLSNTEGFLAQSLWKAFYGSPKKNNVKEIETLRAQLNDCFDFMAWDAKGTIISNSINPDDFDGEWQMGFQTIRKVFLVSSENWVFSPEEEENYKRLFGPQFIPEGLKDCRDGKNQFLLWTDSSKKMPVLWIGWNSDVTLVVSIKPQVLAKKIGLNFHINNFPESPFEFGYMDNGKIESTAPIPDISDFKKQLSQKLPINQFNFSTSSAISYPRFITENLVAFVYVNENSLVDSNSVSPSIATLFFLVLLIPYIVVSFKTIVFRENIRFSITLKLSLLFAFSGGLPLSMLFFIGYDYLNQKEYALLDEVHMQATRYLQNFDERFESEYAHRIVLLQSALDEYIPILKKEGMKPESYFPFAEKICKGIPSISDIQIYLIASSAKTIGTEESLHSKNNIAYPYPKTLSEDDKKKKKEAVKIFRSIGKFILDGVNGNAVDERVSTEVELLTESAMQKSVHELQQEFISADGKIRLFGLGSKQSPTYVDFLSISENGKQDYLLLVLWDINTLDEMYLNRQFLNANRNIQNLKIFACSEVANRFYPADLRKDFETRAYVDKFAQKPHPTRQFITKDHQKYLIMGFKGKFMRAFNLFALYPVREIEERIYSEKKSLITGGIFAILIIFALGNLLSKSFIFPLKIISEGAEAIRNKDFDVRLPIPGNDEFGEIAQVFNETMVDLDELKVAGIVQEQLLPKVLPETGNCKLFGKNISMGDVGGDYYDYFNSCEDQFSVLIGDVSGHGVGAALIMAMAKAGILHSEDFLNKPSELVHRMHNLIFSARTSGQKRFMSFQYISMNGTSGHGCYSNAGGWPPLIVNPETKQVTELKLAGALLGALKRPVFSELEFHLSPGEAIILYTDGIIEAMNSAGKMLGFNHFCKIAIEAHDMNPEKYYANIMQAYSSHIKGTNRLSDDLTMIVLVFEGPKDSIT